MKKVILILDVNSGSLFHNKQAVCEMDIIPEVGDCIDFNKENCLSLFNVNISDYDKATVVLYTTVFARTFNYFDGSIELMLSVDC